MMNPTTTVLAVEGMTCASCVRHVGEALRSVPGVASVDVDLREARATVRHEPGAALALVASLHDAGYPATIEPG